ncbi:MAG TPA: glycosyltransferase family 39 protein [Acidobacteriaceae bacterium]|jgi:hypothetical protein|nr:glycosyltransferase family 39 protein [Acidobacteriaceae bacterium]
MATQSLGFAESERDLRPKSVSGERSFLRRGATAIYVSCLLIAISLWFVAIRAPLWLDETGSYWQISHGLSDIWSRHAATLDFPSYSYILGLSAKILGTSEIALRVPSVLAMLGAAYVFYLAARKLFKRDLSIFLTTIFCLHATVSFAAIDVRPYACAELAINAVILVLLTLRKNDSNWLAALLGVLTALIISFQFLFAVFVPAVVICFFAIKDADRRTVWRQFGVACGAFLLASLPLLPGILRLFETRGSHVYEAPPGLIDLLVTFTSMWMLPVAAAVALFALLTSHRQSWIVRPRRSETWRNVLCLSLALVPLFILFSVSRWTTIHMFAPRHRLVAIPGIALLWGLVFERWVAKPLQLLFCVLLVVATASYCLVSPSAKKHGIFIWKSALVAAERNASVDDAPVLICSGFVESNYGPMPSNPKDSWLFTPLSYYKLTVPVVPLPYHLNDETIRDGSRFLAQAIPEHQRFLGMAPKTAPETLDWLRQKTTSTYTVRQVGIFDQVIVLEFRPRE